MAKVIKCNGKKADGKKCNFKALPGLKRCGIHTLRKKIKVKGLKSGTKKSMAARIRKHLKTKASGKKATKKQIAAAKKRRSAAAKKRRKNPG